METHALSSEVVAEETHAGRIWSLLILPAIIGPAISVALYPTGPARFVLVVVGVIGAGALAMVLSGFQYRFLLDGVEIRTIGIHLRTIPKHSILSYSVEPWAMARGYGIRGVGNTRAYVWGNKVVHIKTTNGDVFLGHSDPERIIRILDRMTGIVSRG
jgi:hypothetical protein